MLFLIVVIKTSFLNNTLVSVDYVRILEQSKLILYQYIHFQEYSLWIDYKIMI
jgi:Leucine-rich repeat (LRR) protein